MQFSSALILASVAAVAVAQRNGTAGAASPSGGAVVGGHNGTAGAAGSNGTAGGNSSAKPSNHNESGASYSVANAGIVGAAVAGAIALIL